MTVRLREAQAQAELREVKLKALQLDSQVRYQHCRSTSDCVNRVRIQSVCNIFKSSGAKVFQDFQSSSYAQKRQT